MCCHYSHGLRTDSAWFKGLVCIQRRLVLIELERAYVSAIGLKFKLWHAIVHPACALIVKLMRGAVHGLWHTVRRACEILLPLTSASSSAAPVRTQRQSDLSAHVGNPVAPTWHAYQHGSVRRPLVQCSVLCVSDLKAAYWGSSHLVPGRTGSVRSR